MSPQEVDKDNDPPAWVNPHSDSSEPAGGKSSGDSDDLASQLGIKTSSEDKPSDNSKDNAKDNSAEEGGTPPVSEAQKKSDAEGKKVVDNYSAEIQQKSEELYAIELHRALSEDGHLAKLVQSDNAVDRKMAKKILERNAERFGASNIEEFQKNLKLAAVGDDETARKLIEQEHEIKQLHSKVSQSDWKSWKDSRKVEPESEFDRTLDDIHSKYPGMPFVDVMDFAKGRTGAAPAGSKTRDSFPSGGQGAAQESTSTDSPLARKLLPNLSETEKFAREYTRSFR